MRAIAVAVLAACSLAAAPGCLRRTETAATPPPPAAPVAPASGFTAVDATEVATALADSATRHPWSGDFHAKTGRPPVVAIGAIVDKTGDHVDTVALADELARALGRSDQVTVAPAGSAGDVLLGGSINLSHSVGGAFYQIDLRIVPTAGGDPLWLDAIERRQGPPVASRGAPADAPAAKP